MKRVIRRTVSATAITAVLAYTALLLAADTTPSHKSTAPAAPVDKVLYNRDIRPVLSDNCFACHGPDKSHRKARLRLDEREIAIEKKAIVPNKPDESELVKRLFSKDPDELMPPAESHKTLTPAQKDLFKRWIAQGAEYQSHWSYLTPVRSPIPAVNNAAWSRNPIDAFILKELEAKSIAPSKEADRAMLLRRLSLDLIGLPPTPAERDAFLKNSAPDAYEKEVDRLLASPHFGERMAAPWLDNIRFADTVGYHGDQNQNVFPYRDYVINAFNTNKPFDQFTTEQLAGDLLPNPTPEQLTATCFNRLNMMTREGGAQPKEYLAKYQADRVRTVATTWLGSTFGCAECHNHKFDPITQRDFYSLGAFFADVKQWGVYSDYSYTPNPDLKGYTNDFPFPPEITVESAYLKNRQAALRDKIAASLDAAANKLKADPAAVAALERWQQSVAAMIKQGGDPWITLKAVGLTEAPAVPAKGKPKVAAAKPAVAKPAPPQRAPAGKAADVVALEDGSILLTGAAGATDRLEFELPQGPLATIRIEALPNDRHGNTIIRGGAPSASLTITAALKSDGKERPLPFYAADADHSEPRYANGYAQVGIKEMWRTSIAHKSEKQTATCLIDAPADAKAGDRLIVTLSKSALGCVRVSISPLGGWGMLNANSPAPGAFTERNYLSSTAADPQAFAEFKKLHGEIQECRGGKNPVLITQALATPLTMRILPRGNWQDETGEVVLPAAPAFLPRGKEFASTADKRLTRLDLAKWILAPENPLTARVFVNRLWKQYFGAGLCNSIEDFGAQGEWPSHPELLDWLAVEFRERGWDVKHIVRLMVTSAAYRQSSSLRPELKEVDGANRLLASQNPRRLEAEFVRDNALFAAGLLDVADIGGPSAHPYQPAGYYVNIQFPDRNYIADTDERQYRRGLYMHWQRTFLHPMLANFDAPSREDCICTRTLSNTPQQALTLLNDPTFVEAARVLASRAMSAAANDDARVEQIYQRVLLRSPRDKERQSLKTFLAANRDYFKANLEDAKKLTRVGNSSVPEGLDDAEWATWTSLARVVLNLHESITRY